MSLAACADKTRFATVEAFCAELPSAPYAVRGATAYDQGWVDDTTEAVIAGCDRPRPQPRPASWDAPPAPAAAPAQAVDANGTPARRKPRSIADIIRGRW